MDYKELFQKYSALLKDVERLTTENEQLKKKVGRIVCLFHRKQRSDQERA